MSKREYAIYIIRCADGTLYTGIATDVARRLREHESGRRGAKYIRGRGPLQLVFERAAGDRAAASRIERRIKQLERSEKEALIAGDSALWSDVLGRQRAQTSGDAGA